MQSTSPERSGIGAAIRHAADSWTHRESASVDVPSASCVVAEPQEVYAQRLHRRNACLAYRPRIGTLNRQ